jgi:hypothetical protein
MKSRKIIRGPKADILIAIVKSVTGVDPTEQTRGGEVVDARKLFYKVMKDVEKMSFFKMGAVFGQDHATSRHAVRDLEALLTYDKDMIDKYSKILSAFTTSLRAKDRIDGNLPETMSQNGHIYEKLMDINDQLTQQNLYIAQLKVEVQDMNKEVSSIRNENSGLDSIFNMIVERVPKGKSAEAKRQIQKVLNGL